MLTFNVENLRSGKAASVVQNETRIGCLLGLLACGDANNDFSDLDPRRYLNRKGCVGVRCGPTGHGGNEAGPRHEGRIPVEGLHRLVPQTAKRRSPQSSYHR